MLKKIGIVSLSAITGFCWAMEQVEVSSAAVETSEIQLCSQSQVEDCLEDGPIDHVYFPSANILEKWLSCNHLPQEFLSEIPLLCSCLGEEERLRTKVICEVNYAYSQYMKRHGGHRDEAVEVSLRNFLDLLCNNTQNLPDQLLLPFARRLIILPSEEILRLSSLRPPR